MQTLFWMQLYSLAGKVMKRSLSKAAYGVVLHSQV